MAASRTGLGWLALLGSLWFAPQARAEERPAPGTFLPRDPTIQPYHPSSATARSVATRPEQNDAGLRLYLLLGGSVSGRASYSLPNGDLPRRSDEGFAPPKNVRPSGDIRIGATLPIKRWLALDVAGTYTSLQTQYFQRHGRQQRSRVVNLRVGPMLRKHTGRRRASPILLASLSAGPSWAFISSDLPYVNVRENTSPKTSFVVAASIGMEIPLSPDVFGLRLQLNYEWLRADYASQREAAGEDLGTDNLKVKLGRTVGLLGIWVQL